MDDDANINQGPTAYKHVHMNDVRAVDGGQYDFLHTWMPYSSKYLILYRFQLQEESKTQVNQRSTVRFS